MPVEGPCGEVGERDRRDGPVRAHDGFEAVRCEPDAVVIVRGRRLDGGSDGSARRPELERDRQGMPFGPRARFERPLEGVRPCLRARACDLAQTTHCAGGTERPGAFGRDRQRQGTPQRLDRVVAGGFVDGRRQAAALVCGPEPVDVALAAADAGGDGPPDGQRPRLDVVHRDEPAQRSSTTSARACLERPALLDTARRGIRGLSREQQGDSGVFRDGLEIAEPGGLPQDGAGGAGVG